MIWSKLYVLQRDRCDWPDILNLIHRRADEIDWEHLLTRLGEDASLLGAVLYTYGWLCPANGSKVPIWVWDAVHPESGWLGRPQQRTTLLDSRPWLVDLKGDLGRC